MDEVRQKRRSGPKPQHNPAKGSIAERLVVAFTAWGGTQAGLAAKMKTRPSVVSRLLSGSISDPHWSTIENFAQAIGAEATVLFTQKEGSNGSKA